MTLIRSGSPGQAIADVQNACDSGAIMNLTVSFPMELPAANIGFLASYSEEARRWQNPSKPKTLFLNHGEYMHAHGDPIEYLIAELKNKSTSNRACISLSDTRSIMESGDGPLPSFMLVQVGFENSSRDVLHITAYYRALEVISFLPINVTELALISESIADGITSFCRAEVTMHAFRAHAQPGFRALKKCALDMATPTQVHNWVERREWRIIADHLRQKAAPASIVETSGLATLTMEGREAGWSEELMDELDCALKALDRLRTARVAGTHGGWIDGIQGEISRHLLRAADLVNLE